MQLTVLLMKYFSPGVSYDAKIVDIAEKNNISVYTKNEFYRLVQSEKRNRNELTELKARKNQRTKASFHQSGRSVQGVLPYF